MNMADLLLFTGFAVIIWLGWWASGVVTDTHFNRLLDDAEKKLTDEGKFKKEDLAAAKAKIKKEHKL